MKVLHICQWDNPAYGGATKVAFHFVMELRKQGVDAHLLFVYGHEGWFGEQLIGFAHYLRLMGSREVLPLGFRLFKFLNDLKPDIIHHHEGLIWTYLFSTGMTKKRLVHGHVAGGVRSFGFRTKIAHFVQFLYAKRLLCISEHTKQTWIDVGYPIKYIDVLPNGVDLNQYRPLTPAKKQKLKLNFGIPLDKLVIGYVGRLHCVMKGVDDFVKTISLLPDNYFGLIVGEGQDLKYLNELSEKLGITNKIKFLGSISNTSQIYNLFEGLLFTSNFEHFGLVPLEASACKVPVFMFHVEGGINEIKEKVQFFCTENRDHFVMSTLIQESLRIDNKSVLNQNLLNLKKNYSWEAIVKRLVNTYENL